MCGYIYINIDTHFCRDIASLLKATSIHAYNYVYFKALTHIIQYLTSNIYVLYIICTYLSALPPSI